MLIDTHTHLDFSDFDPDRSEVIEAARAAGVTRMIAIGTRVETSRNAVELAAKYPGTVFPTVGLHPSEAGYLFDDAWFGALEELARANRIAAIGETGLDYHRLPSAEIHNPLQESGASALGAPDPSDLPRAIEDGQYKSAQAIAFRAQLELAVDLGLNVVIHQRDAWDDTLEILEPYTGKLRGVFHCFGGTPEQAAEVLNMGHLVSFTGIATFKNAEILRETIRSVPAGKWMVETDCPYLAPVPHRGKRCEPAHARLVLEAVAALRGLSLEEAARESNATAEGFFRLS